MFALHPTPLPAASPEIAALRAAGTPRLALSVVDAEQPPAEGDRAGWLELERTRLDLLRELGDWAAIEARVSAHPRGLPRAFTDLGRSLQAEAALARGDGASARARLRALTWQGERPAGGALHHWREQLIRAYLLEGLIEDAHLAMIRYRQDYGDDDPALRELGVRILLRAGRPDAALVALGNAADPAADALRLLAELRAGRRPAEAIGQAAETQARVLQDDPVGATRYWAVAVEAAALAEQGAARIAALEAGLPATDLPPSEAPFALTPDALWRAYRAHGETLGNRAQLLVGQDDAWFEFAAARAVEAPLDARALHATLAQAARAPELRAASHAALIDALATLPRGALLLRRLYLDDLADPRTASLPAALRQRLADEALTAGDPAAAARLYATLDAPPADVDAFAWKLRRARLLARVDAAGTGGGALQRLITEHPERAAAEVDALLTAIGGLQRAGAHAAADAVLAALLAGAQDTPARQRALLLARAENARALGDPRRAARHYLHGAMLPGTDAGDAAGHAARRAAVGELIAAGLDDDAVALLEALIAETPKKRREPLEEELRRLRERG